MFFVFFVFSFSSLDASCFVFLVESCGFLGFWLVIHSTCRAATSRRPTTTKKVKTAPPYSRKKKDILYSLVFFLFECVWVSCFRETHMVWILWHQTGYNMLFTGVSSCFLLVFFLYFHLFIFVVVVEIEASNSKYKGIITTFGRFSRIILLSLSVFLFPKEL